MFVARDGEFLKEVLECWQAYSQEADPLTLHYAKLSRPSVNLLAYHRIDDSSVRRALAVRAGTPTARSLLRFMGVDAEALPAGLQRSLDTLELSQLADWAQCDVFQQEVAAQRKRLTVQLRAYLGTWGLPRTQDVALVDIGWQGSIVRTLQEALCLPGEHLRLYQMGHWSDTLPLPDTPACIEGLIGDWRRGRNIREGAVYQLAFLLEAVCRAHEMPVVGYDGLENVYPRLAPPTETVGESENAAWREPIRQGVLDAVRAAAREMPKEDMAACRRVAQARLWRLAWFPNAAERASARGLRRTEGHASGFSAPMIATRPPRLWTSPRVWMAGLASPWRTAYLMETGGVPLAALYAFLEALLLAAPPHWRNHAQRLARRLGRLP